MIAKIGAFENKELVVPQSEVSQKERQYAELEEQEREKLKVIDEKIAQKSTPAQTREEAKKDWIQNSFWAPGNAPKVVEDDLKGPSQ